MSEYRPISSWHIARTLMREGLIVPRAGSAEYLSEEHDRIEAESRALCAAMRTIHGIPEGFQAPFDSAFEAISNFVAEASDAIWARTAKVSSARFVSQYSTKPVNGNFRPRTIRRRILLLEVRVAGVPERGLDPSFNVDCLVRRTSLVNPRQTVSAKLSVGHDAIEGELFGGIRTGSGKTTRSSLIVSDSYFCDGVLSAPMAPTTTSTS